jgi:UDP-N-acetylglucosamine--N-acetylmuramyl-(pentapeptide) pyrophosphoryl-undecaprenol N-acetylglucosamine transferase
VGRLIIAGGGTGGHLYPGIAVAERIETDILFLVSDRGIEKRALTPLGYNFREQKVKAFSGQGILGRVRALSGLLTETRLAMRSMQKGDKVLLMGGFAAAPAAVASVLKGVDMYIHEQNSIMGLVNRVMARFAKKVFLSYGDTEGAPAEKSTLVGNPVRRELLNGNVQKEAGKRLLIIGGSGGARTLNRTVAQAAEELVKKGWSLRHQTGVKLYEETLKLYGGEAPEGVSIEPYIDNMFQAYNETDILLARSGSGTVFEALHQRRPALYIPLPTSAANHQFYNARLVEAQGCAKVLEERDLSVSTLVKSLESMVSEFDTYKVKLEQAELFDSADMIVKGMGLSPA